MIKIATAECFTHGKIGRELHAIAQGYTGNLGEITLKILKVTEILTTMNLV